MEVVGLGVPVRARLLAPVTVADTKPIYVVASPEQAELFANVLGDGSGPNVVLAVTLEGQRLVDSLAAEWGEFAGPALIDLRDGVTKLGRCHSVAC